MRTANQEPWRDIILWVRLFFAFHLIYSGMAYILGGWTPSDMTGELSAPGKFMVALDQVGMYPFVKYLETLVGFALLFNIGTPIALVAELPVSFTIFFLNLFAYDGDSARHLFTGPQELLLNVSLMFAYGGYYANMCRVRVKPYWLWDGLKHNEADPTARLEVR
ncbi:MAG: hypothetical protein RBS88_07510 [Spongiibacteraceae bacterium]|jgi:hypothetical protein|nr:hypothetical protein [Spongiibacteraceae bacterium]